MGRARCQRPAPPSREESGASADTIEARETTTPFDRGREGSAARSDLDGPPGSPVGVYAPVSEAGAGHQVHAARGAVPELCLALAGSSCPANDGSQPHPIGLPVKPGKGRFACSVTIEGESAT